MTGIFKFIDPQSLLMLSLRSNGFDVTQFTMMLNDLFNLVNQRHRTKAMSALSRLKFHILNNLPSH